MDIDDDASVITGVDHVLSEEGKIDVVVNNAGYGLAGSVEDTSIEEAKAQLETNFFGAMRVCRAVLPSMRESNHGYIINVGSMAGLMGVPYQALYSASKYAIEGFTEALSGEMRSFGIHVVVIEPGDFNTNFTGHRRRAAGAELPSAYYDQFHKSVGVMEADESHGPSPEKVAILVERIIDSSSPRLRYAVGSPPQKVAIRMKRLLPSRLFEFLMMKYYKLH